MNTILIGIAGGTGSGKTTLTRHLKEHFGKDVTVIGHDSYYKRQVGRTYEERAKVNYDHPNAFDTDLLIRHLQELKAGRSIQCPVYSFVEHNRTDQTVEIQPAKVIIVEGILIFQNPTLRDMFDIKIFVETDVRSPAWSTITRAPGRGGGLPGQDGGPGGRPLLSGGDPPGLCGAYGRRPGGEPAPVRHL